MNRWLSVVFCIVTLTCFASATDLYNNLDAASFGSDPIATFGPLYDSFSTGGSTFSLASVAVKLDYDGTPTGSFTVGLYADNSTSPDGLLYTIATVNDSSLTAGLNDYVYTLATAQTLAANTRYWIGLASANNDTSAFWSWSLDTSGVGVANEFFANSNGVFSNDNGPYQMRVSDAVVPEPSTLLLLGTGLVGLTGAIRRKMT